MLCDFFFASTVLAYVEPKLFFRFRAGKFSSAAPTLDNMCESLPTHCPLGDVDIMVVVFVVCLCCMLRSCLVVVTHHMKKGTTNNPKIMIPHDKPKRKIWLGGWFSFLLLRPMREQQWRRSMPWPLVVV